MTDREILSLTAVQLGEKIKEGAVTAPEAAEAALGQMERLEPILHSYVSIERESAVRQAGEVQKKIEAGELNGALAGVPVALKDNLCVKGMRTTCCSRILEHFVPAYTAKAVENLTEAGAVILGKTNMDEFAMGSTTETSAFGVTRNPWDINRVPGGSSGGSCGAVAAAECFYALGSDTGGSIRQPSSFCGVTGLKPTYVTVSRYGLVAYGSSLDQIGPVTKDVTDCAAVLEILASHDRKDSTSVEWDERLGRSDRFGRSGRDTVDAEKRGRRPHGEPGGRDARFTSALVDDVKGMRIGICRDYLGEGLDGEIREAVMAAAGVMREKGAAVEEFHLGLVEYAIPAYYCIASAEASSNLARFDGVNYGYRTREYNGLHDMYKKSRTEGFGAEVKRRIMLGSFVLSSGYYDAYYLKALKVRAQIKKAFDEAFSKYDVILGPVSPVTAPRLGESLRDPLKMYLGDIYTISVNLAGLPAMSVPCGTDSKGLPIGLQLIGDCFQERTLLRAAYAFEKSRERKMPRLAEHAMDSGLWETSGLREDSCALRCPGGSVRRVRKRRQAQ